MTPTANWTPTAIQDLDEIVYWIAVEDKRPEIAFKIAEELRDKADHFATIPGSGQHHPELSNDWLWFRHKRWLVFYRQVEGGIDVMRVIDGARDFRRIFADT